MYDVVQCPHSCVLACGAVVCDCYRYALVVFMTSRLPSFVLDNGAAFICTTDGWILASTLPGPDLSVLVFMPELLFPNTSELASYSANITVAHPAAMQFLRSLYNNMQSAAWQANINSLSLSDAATPYQLGWEQSERINGAECYVQYAVLGVPASSFSFVLVVYSRQSDYQGGLLHNATLSGVLSAVVILVSILATLLLTQCVNRPILTLISAMKAVLGDNPWQKNPAAATAVAKAWKSKGSHRASFAESANKAANGQHASSIQSEGKPAVDDSPDPQSPSSPGTDQLTPLPVALPSPSRLDHVQKSGDMTLLDHDFLRTSSCSTMPDSINAAVSPHASTVTRTLGQAADGTSPSIPNKSIGQWQPIEAQPAVYAKYVPPTDTSHPNKPGSSNTQADKAASMTIVNPPQSAATSTVVHYPTCISTDEPSKANRQSRSQLDDSSSYELDLLLQKWQRTMLAQGVRLPPEWETDLQEDAQRLRELRMGLREARKRYQGKRRHARAQQDEHGASTAAGSDNEDDDDDRSVFTPNDGRLSAFTKLAMYLRSRTRRVDGDPSNASKHFEHSTSHTSISSNSTSSNHSSHPVGCSCSACQLHRFTNRLFGCAGNFSEVVQLQLTFGAMLFRLRNSALKLEQANQSKRLFLRFVFHEVRVPLNALGLGVEQLYEIGIGEREKREMHATHLQKQQAVLGRMEDELHSSTGSMQTLSALMMQLDQLLFDCPLCAPSTMTAPHHPSHLSSSLLMPNDSSPASTSSTDATSLALLHIVQDQVATVTRILNDVLSFQRIEDGELKLEMAPFNVCVMVDNTLHSFQAEFRQKQLQVKTEYRHYGREREQTMAGTTRGAQQQQQQQQQQREEEGVKSTDIRVDIASRETSAENGLAGMEGVELQHIRHAAAPSSALSWHVSGDQYRLRQVLSNFVSNAVKFSRQGGSITVLATLTPALTSPASTAAPATTPPSGAHHPTAHFLELAVRDSGIGISPSGLRSLFQPYSQIRPGALQEGKGSGLGLSICKKLVELHGGRVVVSSTPGEGSTFSLGVPVEVMREAEVKEMLRQQAGSSQSREPLAKDEETEEGEEAEQDEEESKQLEGMDAEALEDGLYKYRPKGTEEAPLTVTVPHITPRTDTPSAGVEATQRTDSEPPSFAASSPFALTPNTVRELVMDANTASLPLPQSATATAAVNLSHSVRLPTRRLAPTAVASNRPASPNTPPGLGSAADSRRRVQSSDRKLGEERLRALVVEDSAVNRKLLVMMIEKMGLAVESAEDGQYAYELVANYITEQHAANTTDGSGSAGACSSTRSAASADRSTAVTCQYDVIFMDDHMPRSAARSTLYIHCSVCLCAYLTSLCVRVRAVCVGSCTGVECVAQLRALGVTIPIFGITANALLEDQQRFVAAGVTAVITKPMQKKQLVDMIATVRRIKDEQRKINKQQQMGRDATKQ